MTTPSPVVRVTRHGRDVRLDKHGMEYVRASVEDDGMPFYITPCCDASAKGMEWGTGCRACYAECDPAIGGIPEPLPADETQADRDRAARWAEFMRGIG